MILSQFYTVSIRTRIQVEGSCKTESKTESFHIQFYRDFDWKFQVPPAIGTILKLGNQALEIEGIVLDAKDLAETVYVRPGQSRHAAIGLGTEGQVTFASNRARDVFQEIEVVRGCWETTSELPDLLTLISKLEFYEKERTEKRAKKSVKKRHDDDDDDE